MWMLPLAQFFTLILGIKASAQSLRPSPVVKGTVDVASSQFITTQNGEFFVNGSRFTFIGTNAYWLHTLNTDEDIDKTLADISATGVKVVRTWAFNDVETIPEVGTWFQLINNGTVAINNGTNGLQRLDKVVEFSQKHGIYLLLSLTNNWSLLPLNNSKPAPNDPSGASLNTTRNILSNDYGGMDVYVRQLGHNLQHDSFYTDNTIMNAFNNYISQIVSRYKNNPFILGWEIANDPRCNSSLPATPTCNTTTITKWHSIIAQHILNEDPNHLVSTGNQGFFCLDCPKLFARVAPSSRVSTSLVARAQKNSVLTEHQGLTSGDDAIMKSSWVTTPRRRQQNMSLGIGFDGTFGVDSEDIISIPEIAFGSLQLFPDQNVYGPVDPTLPPLNQTYQQGIDWIKRHIEMGQQFGKPVCLLAFGLVTVENTPKYVPFGPDEDQNGIAQQPVGVTDGERDESCRLWLGAGIFGGLQGIFQYQWGQGNLTAQAGTTVPPSSESESGVAPNQDETGVSPNDGYSILGISHDEAIEILKIASQQIALAGQMPASQQSSAPEQPPAPQETLPPNSCPEVHISFFCISAISVISWVLHDFVI